MLMSLQSPVEHHLSHAEPHEVAISGLLVFNLRIWESGASETSDFLCNYPQKFLIVTVDSLLGMYQSQILS